MEAYRDHTEEICNRTEEAPVDSVEVRVKRLLNQAQGYIDQGRERSPNSGHPMSHMMSIRRVLRFALSDVSRSSIPIAGERFDFNLSQDSETSSE